MTGDKGKWQRKGDTSLGKRSNLQHGIDFIKAIREKKRKGKNDIKR